MSYEKLVKQNEELEYQLKCKEQELLEYKKSKQASYEAMQRKCNKIELKNRALQKEYLFLKEEIKILGDNFNSSNRAWEEIFDRYKQALAPFEDEYFKDLDTKTIAELAKKSFRLTRENRKMEDVLDEIEDLTIENLEKHYNHCKYAKGCVNPCGINNEVNLNQILDIINKADFRTDAAPVSEDIELTKPKRLSSETIRAQKKSKTAKEVKNAG